MRPTGNDHELRSLDQSAGAPPGSVDRQDAIGIAVQNESWNSDTAEVGAEIFVPRTHTGDRRRGGASRRYVPTCLHRLIADSFPEQKIGVVEVLEELGKERKTVRGGSLFDTFENASVNALGIVGRLQ